MARRPPPQPAALAALLVVALGAAGCATVRLLLPRPEVAGGRPWEVPEDALGTQRLYRLRYADPTDRVDLKLALYLESRERFRLQATADLGRKLWTLDVAAGDAVWQDHREREACRAPGAEVLRVVPLGDLPVTALPRVLLGLLPMAPAEPPRPEAAPTVAYRDAYGHLWHAGFATPAVEVADADAPPPPRGEAAWGELRWWSLVGEDGEPTLWWRWQDDAAVLVDRGAERELRWGEVARETLAAPLGPPAVPTGYAEVPCDGSQS